MVQEINTSTFPLEKPVESAMDTGNRSNGDFWARHFLLASLGHCTTVTGVAVSLCHLYKTVNEPN